MIKKQIDKIILAILFVCFSFQHSNAGQSSDQITDTAWQSTTENAMKYLNGIKEIKSSIYWPNIDPDLFLENLKTFVLAPLKFYEAKSTNFCAYSALTFIPLTYDPEGFCRFMVELYQTGTARMGKVRFHPGKKVRTEAGLLKYKGSLDISPVGQMWFLSLADHFKGYINLLNRNFNKGDENTLWAATNFAKFNRMLRRLFPIEVKAKGSDLIRPWISDLPGFLQEKAQSKIVFLYVNNRLLYKKNNAKVRFGIPTHFLQLIDIHDSGEDQLTIIYSGYGSKTLQVVDRDLLKKILFGITWIQIPGR